MEIEIYVLSKLLKDNGAILINRNIKAFTTMNKAASAYTEEVNKVINSPRYKEISTLFSNKDTDRFIAYDEENEDNYSCEIKVKKTILEF